MVRIVLFLFNHKYLIKYPVRLPCIFHLLNILDELVVTWNCLGRNVTLLGLQLLFFHNFIASAIHDIVRLVAVTKEVSGLDLIVQGVVTFDSPLNDWLKYFYLLHVIFAFFIVSLLILDTVFWINIGLFDLLCLDLALVYWGKFGAFLALLLNTTPKNWRLVIFLYLS